MTALAPTNPWPTRARRALWVYWPTLAIASHWPRLNLGIDSDSVFQLDKAIHFVAFGVLAWLLIQAKPLDRRAPDHASATAAMLLAVAYAVADEFTQGFTQRHMSLTDLWADLLGIGTVYLWLAPRDTLNRSRMTVTLTRAAILLLGPTLLAFAMSPRANQQLLAMYDWIGLPRYGTDKWVHFWLGIGLTWLLALATPLGARRRGLGAALIVLGMALSAPVIEDLQRITGRSYELADVTAHQQGLLVAVAGWMAVVALRPLLTRLARHGHHAAAARAALEQPHLPAASGGDRASTAPADAPGRGFVRHAALVSGFTGLSRVTGLARDATLAGVFGLGTVLDAFFIGFLVPNLFRRLFGEGALTAAFIPRYTELLGKDPALARRFAWLVIGGLAVGLAGVTLLGEALLAAWSAGPGLSDKTALAVRLTMWMLPYMPLVCLVALLGAVLQVHGRFGPPAAAPVVLNAVMVVAALGGAWFYRDAGSMRPAITVVAGGVLVAGVLQVAYQLAAVWRHAPPTASFGGAGPTARAMLGAMAPMLIGLGVFQLNALLDSLIAFGLSPAEGGASHFQLAGMTLRYPIEPGAVSALSLAQRLYQFPLGLFGIAIATAIFPALSRAAAGSEPGGPDHFGAILRQGLRLTVFIALPASVGLVLVRVPLARLVFERGELATADAVRIADLVMGYAVGLWAYSLTHVLTRAFYARHDVKTPLRISAAMVGLNLCLNLVLIWPLGAAGLAWSTAITASGQAVLLLRAVGRYTPSPADAAVRSSWARTAAWTAAMALVLGPAAVLSDPASLSGGASAALLAGLVAGGAAVVLVGAALTGAPELRWLRRTGPGAEPPPR